MAARIFATLVGLLVAIGAMLTLISPAVAARPSRISGQPSEHQFSADQIAKYDKLGPLFGEIGKEAVDLVGGRAKRLFIYVEMPDGWPIVCEDRGNTVRLYPSSLKLRGLIEEAWALENQDARKRWLAIEYDLRDGSFDVSTVYPDEIDPKSVFAQRLAAALSKRFSGKRLLAARVMQQEFPEMKRYSEEYPPVFISPP